MTYPRYKIFLAFADIFILAISFLVTWNQFYDYNDLYVFKTGIAFININLILLVLYSILVLFVLDGQHLYKINVIYDRPLQINFLLKSFFYTVSVLIAIVLIVSHPNLLLVCEAVLFMSVIGFFGIGAFRIGVLPLAMKYCYRKNVVRKRLLVVGSYADAKRIAVQLGLGNIYGLNLVGFVLEDRALYEKVHKGRINLGTIEDIPRIVNKYQIDEILIAFSEVGYDYLFKTLDVCKRSAAHVVISSGLLDVINNKIFLEKYYEIPVVRLKANANDRFMLHIKRLIDLSGAVLGLMLLSPLYLFIMLLIKLSSKGPIIYTQKRIGKDGKEFVFYKFRSMYNGSDNGQGRAKEFEDFIHKKCNAEGVTKIVDEKKITKIGKFLRKTSLDELPQLLNVIKGDMSLVGPRPCLPYEWNSYDDWHKRRMSVVPGCTGLWQVVSRAKGSFDDMVLLDIYYINNMSPLFDIKLIFRTIPVMVFGRGGK